ncbi:hypothetical protein SAMN05443432_11098 [Roseovarius litoreus]|uniref:Sulfotransferase family protein n=1 Tax=Roseovarius litoreus TaxID=1155722 RepID=A0A1M7KEC1_9RHOB|nr:hypothetical protein [Roseovarius litoreus]SHM63592.1 hypothetical protein SAMN05443432_11098 [Roseovarius litoreus]
MLWIHIGMPKTGTTALQGFLHSNPDFLASHGIRYLASGRDRGTGVGQLICHNAMAVDMSRNWSHTPDSQPQAFRAEYDRHRDEHCIISSEMFFGRDLSSLYERVIAPMQTEVTILVYLRRFDDFIEADYKQRAKNGRLIGGQVDAFVRERIERIETDPEYLNFGTLFDRIRDTIPDVRILPRLYLREEMTGGNVITDVMSVLGVPSDTVPLPETNANRSLSRLASEAIGLFDPTLGFDKKRRRRLARALQAMEDPRLFRRNDVLTTSERKSICDLLEKRNADMRKAFFPTRRKLFPTSGRKPTGPERGHPDELAEFQYVMQAALRVISEGR